MIFPTIEFAAFFLVVLLVSWLLMHNPKWWKPFILSVSLFFYGFTDLRWVGLLVVSIVANQAFATLITRSSRHRFRKGVLISAVAFDLALLGVFKYFNFFIDSFNSILDAVNLGMPLNLLEIALPIGISFFTFQAISYVVDVYQGTFRLAKPLDFAVYLSFFPHLVAGPIVRAREFIPQLAAPRDPRRLPATAALFLIAGGLIKKIVLADLLATRLVDPVFGNPGSHSAVDTALAILGYTAQIYCDFSAYTDIAIGLAMLMGFRFPQNFDRPYRAASLQDFWHRWHMTLSRWLRDYLYIPLGGSRKGPRRTYINLMITMVLGGLWHGAAWTFVLWGTIHGSGLSAERWLTVRRTELRGQQPATAGTAPGPGPGGSALGGSALVDLREPAATTQAIAAVRPGASALDAGRAPAVHAAVGSQASTAQPREPLPADAGSAQDLTDTARIPVVTAEAPAAVSDGRLYGRPLRGVRARARRAADALALAAWPHWLRWAVTFAVVSLAWVFFRADSVATAFEVLFQLVLGWGEPVTLVTPAILAVLLVALGTQWVPQGVWRWSEARFSRLHWVIQGVLFGVLLIVINAIVGQQGVAPFIYFRF